MSYGTNNKGGGYGGRNRGGSFRKGQHVYAKMGANLPIQPVYIQDIKGKEAHISWNNGRSGVVDGDIDIKHLSHGPDDLYKLLSDDPYSREFAYNRVLQLMRRGDADSVDHALQNYILEMEGDPKMLPPKLVEHAKKKGWL